MAIKFSKWLSLSVLATILALFLFLPGIALAAPFGFHTPSETIINSAGNVVSGNIVTDYPNLTELDLTPLQRQQLQGMLQRRNKEIAAVLTPSQLTELKHQLHSGHNFNQALLAIDLQPEQEHLIKAIEQFINLKIKATLVRYSLPN
ncbi:hypothetical protein [Anabaena sp. UHCC 0399]|uniref:hypothetical protein n=1 Tax=Anabaena sp. UHCC 0399 TaxID=3110238 RepID=UPI002B214DEB|nr:hypothetical protein [Anabaena sp. UHCC 0399]MEA5566953.1 hypothetical protein [Anabaena sp. UHCC 0399]